MTRPNTDRNIRCDAKLARISAEKSRKIFDHCEKVTLLEGVAWLQAEHKIKLSDTALGHWLKRLRKKAAFDDFLNTIQQDSQDAQLISETFGKAANLPEAAILLIGQRLFQLFRDGKSDGAAALLKIFTQLNDALLKKKGVEIKQGQLTLGQQKYELEATQRAMLKAPKIKMIVGNPGLSNPEKIQKVRQLLFGEEVA
ncbi:MAG: hypothetical protein WCD79_01990 [Chthoniobacteraceae bacterium]